jgi:hypothetical protein
LGHAHFTIAQPYAATAHGANAPFAKQLNAHVLKRLHDFGQGIHVAADEAAARFHTLNGGQGKPRTLCERGLINAE